MAVTKVCEGWTAAIPFELLDDGATPSGTLTETPTLVMHDKNEQVVNTTGDVAILSGSLWRVTYTPDAADLQEAGSPYRVRFQFTDGSFYPSGPGHVLQVYKQ